MKNHKRKFHWWPKWINCDQGHCRYVTTRYSYGHLLKVGGIGHWYKNFTEWLPWYGWIILCWMIILIGTENWFFPCLGRVALLSRAKATVSTFVLNNNGTFPVWIKYFFCQPNSWIKQGFRVTNYDPRRTKTRVAWMTRNLRENVMDHINSLCRTQIVPTGLRWTCVSKHN